MTRLVIWSIVLLVVLDGFLIQTRTPEHAAWAEGVAPVAISRVEIVHAGSILPGTATMHQVQSVEAAPLRVPASVYPSGAHISYHPVLSNAEMDCMWGFFCEGNVPLFHFRLQEQLHRISGWGQFASTRRYGYPRITFELFVSRYSNASDEWGASCSQGAFLDLKAVLRAHGYLMEKRPTYRLQVDQEGESLLAVKHLGAQDLVVMAAWTGDQEIEGIALHDHKPRAARQTAWSSLVSQIRAATNRSS